jgi:hypothetical protein
MSIFIPKAGDVYYYTDPVGCSNRVRNNNFATDIHRIKSGNCYCTEEDAARARDRQYAKRELEVLADELNDCVEIDWRNTEKLKYYIVYHLNMGLVQLANYYYREYTTYCLSPNFLEVALERLGEEKLKLILEV